MAERKSSEPIVGPGAAKKRVRLPALTGLRVVAALHIYVFHLMQAHLAGLIRFPLFDALPAPLALLISRGFVSTGLFFQLSGFLLAYAYLKADGRPKAGDVAFWRGRFARLYPLYFVSLLLLIPAPALLPITAKPSTPAQTLGMVATNLTLTQAWFPRFAIAWNAPAWALSAFGLFYLVFPGFSRAIAGLGPRALGRLLVILTGLSMLPAGLYLILDPEGNGWTAVSVTLGGFWLNALRFDPLVWLPQFLAGIVLGRFVGLRVDREPEASVPSPARPAVSPGDVVAVALVLFLAFYRPVPYVLLRHGLLSPVFLVLLADLARGRGLIARVLGWNGVARWSEASFGLFALQMPVGVWYAFAMLRGTEGSTPNLLGMIVATLSAAVVWTELVQRPLTDRIRRKDAERSRDGGPPRPSRERRPRALA